MEYKDQMGAPPAQGASAFNGTHSKSISDYANMPGPVSPLRPDATRAVPPSSLPSSLPSSIPSSSPSATSSDQNSVRTIVAAPLAAISPPAYMPDMSTAIVPHPGVHNSFPSAGFVSTDSMKKKRGRPRKYGPDGTVTITIKQSPSPPRSNPLLPHQKRGRGRPPGSGKNQQLAALGDLLCASAGAGFTPHAITVAAGEDVAAKILSFSQQGPRGICILSANGAISNVTLCQPAVCGGTVTYEGRFEILSLSGSFLVTEFSRSGGLSVSLAGPDGKVIGGGVAGMLMAATPVQIVVGSFLCLSKKSYTKTSKADDASKLPTQTAVVTPNEVPEVPLNDRDEKKQGSPHKQSSGNAVSGNTESSKGQMIAVQMGWPSSQEVRPSADIQMQSPGQ